MSPLFSKATGAGLGTLQRWPASPTPSHPWHFSETGQERRVPGNCCSPTRRRGNQWTGLGEGDWRCPFVKKCGGKQEQPASSCLTPWQSISISQVLLTHTAAGSAEETCKVASSIQKRSPAKQLSGYWAPPVHLWVSCAILPRTRL